MRQNSNDKDSILAITFLLLILFVYSRNINLVYATLLFVFISLLSKRFTVFFDQLWKKITQVLGTISSTILLTVIFFLVLFPWGMVLKLFNTKTLLLNSSNLSTTFKNRNKLFSKEALQNPY